MKIRCDVCSKDEASVFCTADEAALCDACDHSVHHANKLASKHHRFSLLHPSSKNFPLCDVCQEKRAFLFCQQDRAILCRDCDAPIHKANEHTQKHDRFLLTGIKLSATSTLYMPSSSSYSVPNNVSDLLPDSNSQQHQSTKKPSNSNSSFSSNNNSTALNKTCPSNTLLVNKSEDNFVINQGIGSVSSTISEYLMETLPGWHVEDFLDFPPTPFAFYKPDDEKLPFVDLGYISTTPFSSEETMGIWVPQAPTPSHQSQQMVSQTGFKETTKEAIIINNIKANNNTRWSDDAFTVPQVSPTSISSKKSRSFWYAR